MSGRPYHNTIFIIIMFVLFLGNLFSVPMSAHALDVTLSWNASSGAAGYKLYYKNYNMPAGPPYAGTGADEGASPIDVGPSISYTLHNLPDVGYRFSLTAYNDYGESGYSAEMVLPPVSLLKNYNLSTTISGSGYLAPASGTYQEGATVTIRATPSAGWVFSGWSGDLGGSVNPATITFNSNKHVLANFKKLAPTINAFTPSPSNINGGESATLAWNITGATAATIEGMGAVNPSKGSRSVAPSFTRTYKLTAANAYGSDTAYAEVRVGKQIVDVIPPADAGIVDDSRIANDTSFAVQINDPVGIDITLPGNILFTIDDGTSTYERDLSDNSAVTVTKLLKEPDSRVTRFWVAYHRSAEPVLGDYDFGEEIRIQVEIINNMAEVIQADYQFQVETEAQYNLSEHNAPATMLLPPGDILIEGCDAGIEITSGNLKGARIVYDSNGPVLPRFGPVDEIPLLNENSAEVVGSPMNLQPHTVFETPVTLFIPCPGKADVSDLCVYLYNGRDWFLACNGRGDLQPGGEGWMVPGSRVNHNDGDPSTIEIQVYHFSGAQAVSNISAGGGGGGGGGCFIATAAFGSPLEKHVEILKRFRDVYLMPNRFGHAFVMCYYRYSPPIAEFIAQHGALKQIVRWSLMPLIGFSYILLHPSISVAWFILFALILCMTALTVLVMKKSQKSC